MRKRFKKDNGITLIALVITIIIMLILVAVTINVAFGENGLISNARKAGNSWKAEQFREQVIADVAGAIGDCYEEGNYNPTLEDVVQKLVDDYEYEIKDDSKMPDEVTVEKDGGTAIIDEDFNVTVEGVPEETGTGGGNENPPLGENQVATPEGPGGHQCPPYTRIYDNKGLTTAPVPDGFVASSTVEEIDISDGKVIKNTGADTSEFVWAPVPNACIDVSELCNDCKNLAIANEVSQGKYPMAIEISTGVYKGVLYKFNINETNDGVKITAYPYTEGGTGFREPDILAHATLGDTATNLSPFGLPKAPFVTFAEQLQSEYNSMVESVIAKGGFYIGRYETSIKAGTGKDATVQSKAGESPMTAATNSGNTWWGMYANQKKYADGITGVTSGMIYGSQWDQVMIFMKDVSNPGKPKPFYTLDSTGMGNYSGGVANTGVNNYKVKNIYDMAGNVWEWTQEVNNTNYRVERRRQRTAALGVSIQRALASATIRPLPTPSSVVGWCFGSTEPCIL